MWVVRTPPAHPDTLGVASDPNIRLHEELYVSEDLRQANREWERFWMIDQPSHMTPTRVHGGVGP